MAQQNEPTGSEQLSLPALTPAPSAAERAFVVLARKWLEEIQTAGRILPASADTLALSCLLLAVEWGNEFTNIADKQSEMNSRAAAARLDRVGSHRADWVSEPNLPTPPTSQPALSWFDELPWRLCSASMASPSDSRPVKELLTLNLDHHNSSIRSWMMEIGWIARSWLDANEAIPRLLANLADTLVGPFMAAGLAAALTPTEDEFWTLARCFEPRSGFEEQYRERLKYIEEHGVLAVQARFWKLEAQCRKAIADAIFGRE